MVSLDLITGSLLKQRQQRPEVSSAFAALPVKWTAYFSSVDCQVTLPDV